MGTREFLADLGVEDAALASVLDAADRGLESQDAETVVSRAQRQILKGFARGLRRGGALREPTLEALFAEHGGQLGAWATAQLPQPWWLWLQISAACGFGAVIGTFAFPVVGTAAGCAAFAQGTIWANFVEDAQRLGRRAGEAWRDGWRYDVEGERWLPPSSPAPAVLEQLLADGLISQALYDELTGRIEPGRAPPLLRGEGIRPGTPARPPAPPPPPAEPRAATGGLAPLLAGGALLGLLTVAGLGLAYAASRR